MRHPSHLLPLALALAATATLAVTTVIAADRPCLQGIAAKHGPLLRRLRNIQCLNLINGLNLSTEQRGRLIGILERLDGILRDLEEGAERHQERAASLLARLEEVVAQGRQPELALAEQTHELSLAAMKAAKRAGEKIDSLAEGVLALLNANQREALARYKPCLVPEPVTAESTSIGSADTGSKFAEGLEKIRACNGLVYFFMRKKIAADLAGKLILFHPGRDRQSLARMLAEDFDRVRALSDVEWAMRRKTIGASLHKRYLPTRKNSELLLPAVEKVRRFLLNTEILDVLRRRQSSS